MRTSDWFTKSLEAQCFVDIYTVMLNGDEISHWILVLRMFQLQLLYESVMFEIMQSKDSKIWGFYSKFTYCTTNGFPVNVKGRSNIAAMAWCFAWDCIHAHTHTCIQIKLTTKLMEILQIFYTVLRQAQLSLTSSTMLPPASEVTVRWHSLCRLAYMNTDGVVHFFMHLRDNLIPNLPLHMTSYDL